MTDTTLPKLSWRRLIAAYTKGGPTAVEKLVAPHHLPVAKCEPCEATTPTFEGSCAVCSTKRPDGTVNLCPQCGQPEGTDCAALNCAMVDRTIEGYKPEHRCENCGSEFKDDDADPSEISDFYERVANAAGEMIPSGQCTCGSLMYPIEALERSYLTVAASEAIADALKTRLLRTAVFGQRLQDAIRRCISATSVRQAIDHYDATKGEDWV